MRVRRLCGRPGGPHEPVDGLAWAPPQGWGGRVIEVRGLGKTYGDVVVIHPLDFAIEQGSIVGLLGINGAGKTTTLRMLTGAISPTSGEVEIDGYRMSDDPIKVKARLGYLPERVPLYEDMTVQDFLAYGARLKGVAHPSRAVQAVCGRVGLSEVSGRLIRHLSKGYRQRVGIAHALVHEPKVLVLDEPTSGLDPAQRVEIRRLIQELASGDTTVVLSTHVLSEVQVLCDQVIVLHEGRVVAQDTIAGLTSARTMIRLEVDNPTDALAAELSSIEGVVQVRVEGESLHVLEVSKDVRAQVARVAVPYGLVNLSTQGQLEEVFLGLTHEESS
jgi:ABC-2 type transport system ATP-binding protein